MCGIIGFWDCTTTDKCRIVQGMADRLIHRGPDDCGVWSDSSTGLIMAHQRLSILDVSPAGHQPMISKCGRFTIVFNGEIYNHIELRSKLPGASWIGHSDTETILAGFTTWGVQETICKAVGMFALAVWDNKDRKLILARDRIGEKPLYYGWQNDTFLFSSELKAMRAHPNWQGEVNRQALTLFLRHNCIPSPWSIYSGIVKLLPGSILTLHWDQHGPCKGLLPDPQLYWNPVEIASKGQANLFIGSENETTNTLDKLLQAAVQAQMISDVPIGAFLSGGIDSSTIVALMQAQSSRPVKTFSIGFDEPEFDEAHYAREVAKHLGTEHLDMYVSDQDARSVIPEIPRIWDEPFSDSSQIPTLLLSRLTKESVTVSLSGDAGDELFGGYNRYIHGLNLWNNLSLIPKPIQKICGVIINAFPIAVWDKVGIPFRFLTGGQVGDKLHKIANTFGSNNPDELYRILASHWYWPEQIVINGSEPPTPFTDGSSSCLENFIERMMLTDLRTYLPDDILVKVDRAAMSTSLETRVPFLDHRVVEFAWSLPLSLKVRNGQGKWILRQVLDRYVPKQLIDRPKKGFGVPLASWLRKPLRDWAESLLSEERLQREGFFNPKPIRQAWSQHLSGKRNFQYHLWDILMFQAWLEEEKRMSS